MKISVEDFKSLINNNSKIPENPDEAFIAKYFVKDDEILKYCVLISTPRLLESSLRAQDEDWCLLCDATYQTNMEGAPVILFGANTFQTGKKYNGIGAIISSNEDKETYDFLLQFVKEEAKTLPLALMADGAVAVSSSCKEILPQCKRLMCWYHASKKMKDKLTGIRNLDASMASQIFSDIHALQFGAPDEESFFILFALLRRKWSEEKEYTTDMLKDRVSEFFLYLSKVWLSPDLRNWYEAANPMMLSTNNSLESYNNVLKRDYTGRKRLSMPHLVQKLKEMMEESSKNPKKRDKRISTVTTATRKSAEELLDTLDKFLLFRGEISRDRPTVKEDVGIVRGKLKAVGICPRQGYDISTREAFNEDCKTVVKRRQSLDYLDFDQFRSDLSKVAIMEVIQLKSGENELFCNCFSSKYPSGSKGEICVHVCARLIQLEIIPRLPVIKKMSSFHARKKMPKNQKQLY